MRVLHALRQNQYTSHTRASEYMERVYIDVAGPVPVKSAGRREYLYVIVGLREAAAAQVGGCLGFQGVQGGS